MAHPLLFGLPGYACRVDVIHVDAVADELEAQPVHLLQLVRIALGEPRGHSNGGFEIALFEGTKDASEADAVAVVAQRVVPIVRVGALEATGWPDALGRHVERKELERGHDPQGDAGPIGPLHGLSLKQVRMDIAIMVHARTAE